MGVGNQIVTTNHVWQVDGRLEAVRAERSNGYAWDGGADVQAAFFTAAQEEVDAVNARALAGALVHRDARHDIATWFDHRTGVGVRQLEADPRAFAGTGRGRRRRLRWQGTDTERGGSRQWAEPP